MRAALIILSILCLSFTFTKDYFEGKGGESASVQEALPAPEEATPQAIGAKAGSVSSVVTAAQAFYNSLSTTQKASTQLTYSTTLARKWSNLPCGSGCRNGVEFSTFSSSQLALAQAVIKEALGTATNDGFDEWEGLRKAEAYLHANGGGSGYDSTLRYIAFLNTPTATGAWMLQFGGHHYAANIAFNGGHVIGATPFFMGIEPKSFTYNGTAYAPLDDEKNAIAAMLASLSSTDLNSAKLSGSFSDCVMIPGETQGGTATFPAKAGVLASSLSSSQQALILAVIQRYTEDMDAATASTVYARYASEIANTYISWRGTGTAGTASSFLTVQGDYARIDGPTVWIEFSCQGGVVISGQIHYHTVWRDHSHDYGLDLTGAAIDGGSSSTGVAAVSNYKSVAVYPNPAGDYINAAVPERLKAAIVTVVNAANGQTVSRITNYSGAAVGVDVSKLPSGSYLLRIDDGAAAYSGRFTKL